MLIFRNLEGLFVLALCFGHAETWNFCHGGIEEKMCSDKRHIVCSKDDVLMAGSFIAEAPMTLTLMKTILHKINEVRDSIAGGNYDFPLASKMRVLVWDNELEFFAIHRSKTCSGVRSECPVTPKYKQAGEMNGFYGQKTKPIRFDTAFEHVFNDVLNQTIDKSILGTNFNEEMAKAAPDLYQLMNDKASRVGCGISLCSDCTSPNSNATSKFAFCYHITCVFDVVNMEGCPVYEISELASGTKCKDVYGKIPKKPYLNLCPNNGRIIEKVKCYGPAAGQDENAEFAWGEWLSGDMPDSVDYDKPRTWETELDGFSRHEIPEIPKDSFLTRPNKIEYLHADLPDGLCADLKGKEGTEYTLHYCVKAETKQDLRHIACHFPHYPPNSGVLVSHEWSRQYDRSILLHMHNLFRDYVASGNEFSAKAKTKFPSAAHMREVIWDLELEWLAMWQTKHCTFAHDKCRGTKNYPLVGQNLGYLRTVKPIFGTATLAFESMMGFFLEKNNVTDAKGFGQIYSYPISKEEHTGHFTQLSIDKISRIGCAFSRCVDEKKGDDNKGKYINLMACHYDADQISPHALYKWGDPTSGCGDWNLGVSGTYKHLCAASKDRNPQHYPTNNDCNANKKGRSEFGIANALIKRLTPTFKFDKVLDWPDVKTKN